MIPLGMLLFAILPAKPAASVVTDRIMAVVNNEVISLSDVRIYREIFEEGRRLDDAAALEKIIDDKLLLVEARKLEIPAPEPKETARAALDLKRQFGRPEVFEAVKQRLLLTDAEIEQQVAQRLQIEKLIEQRILFFVFVTPEEVESVYLATPDSFKDLTPEEARKAIHERRVAEKTESKLRDYIARLRARATIRINRPLPP